MIRDEDGQLTGYVYIDLKSTNYGGFVDQANRRLQSEIAIPAGYGYKWSGEYEFELRAKQRLKLILPIVLFMIFLLLYMVFHSVAEAVVLIVPTVYALSGGLLLQWLLGYNFSVAVWVGYIALFGIAVETGVVMVVYLHESLERRLLLGNIHNNADIEEAVIEGAVKRLRPKLMTVVAVLASLAPILWECDETDCRSYRGRHDYFNHSCSAPCAGLLRDDERTGLTQRKPSPTRSHGHHGTPREFNPNGCNLNFKKNAHANRCNSACNG
jgi:Cu(I)/Ag(I) efflux system membrane protein CusA/SilA